MSEFRRYRIPSKVAFVIVSFALGSLGDGLNPFQAIYLNCIGWNESSIGVALSVMGFSSLTIQTLAGDLIDKTKLDRRYFLAVSSVVSGISASAIMLVREGNQDHALIFTSKMIQGVSTVFIGPSLAAVTLATFGPKHFDHMMASNIFWSHIGGFMSAILAGFVAYAYYPNIKYCFLVIGISAAIAVFSVFSLPIGDPMMGRGFHGKREHLLDEDGNEDVSQAPEKEIEKGPNENKMEHLESEHTQEAATYLSVFTDPAIAVFSITCFFFQ